MTFREILERLQSIEKWTPELLDMEAVFVEPYDEPETYIIGLNRSKDGISEPIPDEELDVQPDEEMIEIVPPGGYYFSPE